MLLECNNAMDRSLNELNVRTGSRTGAPPWVADNAVLPRGRVDLEMEKVGAAAGPCDAYSMGRRDVRAAGGRRPSRSWSPRAPGSNGVQGGAVARRVLLDGEVVAKMCDCLGTASTTTARVGLEPPTGSSAVRGRPINDRIERSAGCPGGAPRAGGWRTEPLDQ